MALAGIVHAQPASDSARAFVRLGALVDEAQRANPRIAVANAFARAAAARVPSASRLPDPQVQFGWMNYELPQFRQMAGLGMTQLQLMQMVPLAGKRRLAGELESARADAASARVGDTEFDVRSRTSMAFYDLYAADEAVTVMQRTRRVLKDVADIARQMYEVGDGRQADVLRATVELARMDEEIIRMETMASVMRSRINALLARPDSTHIGTPLLPTFAETPLAVDSLMQLAEVNRPMIRAGARDVAVAEAAERVARREVWPDLQVGVQLGRQSGSDGPQRMGSLMLGMSVPIYAGNRQYKMRDEAAAMREMASAELASMRAETRGSVAAAHANLMRARRLAELYRASVLPQADATVQSSLAAYRAGTVNFMTLLDAQMTLNRFRQDLLTLEAEEGKAWADLEMLTGRVLVDAQSAQPRRSGGGSPK
jgi:outer membrane protein TolC